MALVPKCDFESLAPEIAQDRLECGCNRTGRERLLELLGLVVVLQDKGVQLTGAADLELDLLGVAVLLDAGRYNGSKSANALQIDPRPSMHPRIVSIAWPRPRQSHLFLFHPFPRFLGPESGKRTGSILAAADLNEVLDVGDFARHVGGIVWLVRW